MKEYPILFQTEMIQAVEPRRTKWQTRRTSRLDDVNKNPDEWKYVGCIIDKDGELINQFLNLRPDNLEELCAAS